jgi:hypothetical protein
MNPNKIMNPEEEAIRIEMIKGERLVSLYKNSIALRQFGLPKSTSFIQELLDYEYVKGKKLSENSEATYAAFCIIEGLIRDSEIDNDLYFRGKDFFKETIFTSFTMTRGQMAENFRISIKHIDSAKKALEDLGLIWIEETRCPHQNEDGEIYRYSNQGLTFTATPRLKKEEFFFSYGDVHIPLNGLPAKELPETLIKTTDGGILVWIPELQAYHPIANQKTA